MRNIKGQPSLNKLAEYEYELEYFIDMYKQGFLSSQQFLTEIAIYLSKGYTCKGFSKEQDE